MAAMLSDKCRSAEWLPMLSRSPLPVGYCPDIDKTTRRTTLWK